GNMTAQKSVKNETSKESVTGNSSSTASVEVKQTGSKQSTKSVEASIETSPMSKASAANKTASV
ncbi:MAG: hypothetical protein LUQ50_01790, partial [Methanospirillum sp.]|uniref:hypothetical protein n=1 Tax=Methanospirillum sp. TaxID=45200 RepID=UPI00236D02B7